MAWGSRAEKCPTSGPCPVRASIVQNVSGYGTISYTRVGAGAMVSVLYRTIEGSERRLADLLMPGADAMGEGR